MYSAEWEEDGDVTEDASKRCARVQILPPGAKNTSVGMVKRCNALSVPLPSIKTIIANAMQLLTHISTYLFSCKNCLCVLEMLNLSQCIGRALHYIST